MLAQRGIDAVLQGIFQAGLFQAGVQTTDCRVCLLDVDGAEEAVVEHVERHLHERALDHFRLQFRDVLPGLLQPVRARSQSGSVAALPD